MDNDKLTHEDILKELIENQRVLMEQKPLKIPVDIFIETYSHINYCEILIDKEGYIFEARPSHTMALLREAEMTLEDQDYIPIERSPLEWLLEKTECVAIWYEFFKTVAINEIQLKVIRKLMDTEKVNRELYSKLLENMV